MDALDIILPLGQGSKHKNIELRFALRSIERYATGYNRIFIIGENPGFLADGVVCHVSPQFDTNKETRIAFKLLWAFQNTDVSDDAVLWNDDYVLLKPVDIRAIPYYQKGMLWDSHLRYSGGRYKYSLYHTWKALHDAGRPSHHYDLHCPIIYNREKYVGLKDWWEASGRTTRGYVVKSVYANNVLDEPGPFLRDCKLQQRIRREGQITQRIQGRWIFSYDSVALDTGLKTWLRREYPMRSKFEVEK